MMNNCCVFLFQSRLNRKNILLLVVMSVLSTLSFNHGLNAKTYDPCFEKSSTNTSTFCYQAERQKELMNAIRILEKSFNKQKIISIQKPVVVNKTLSNKILIDKPSSTRFKKQKISEVKPRLISRGYEQAISVLDETGKKNLLHCFEQARLGKISLNESFYIKAMKKILNSQLPGKLTTAKRVKRSIDQDNCNKLIDLVVG